MNKHLVFIFFSFMLLIISSCENDEIDDADLGGTRNVNIELTHNVGTTPFVLGNTYTNAHNENYKINKFAYYISNVALTKLGTTKNYTESESYHLINASDISSTKFNFIVNHGDFNALVFYVGVDSLRNVSGAQTGALDPLNGMFWTWNSGYIMAKMEGTSTASTEPGGEMTYHIGGFSGVNNAVKKVVLPFPTGVAQTAVNGTCTIKLKVDINKWFSGVNPMKIADGALMMSISDRSRKIAENYATMFNIESVTN